MASYNQNRCKSIRSTCGGFFHRQSRKYRTLAPSWLWGRLPGHFFGLLFMLGLFQRKGFAVDAALRSLVSVRIAQLNGRAFCLDLNSYNLRQATGSASKVEAVNHWRNSEVYTEKERTALDYAEAMTDTARRDPGADRRAQESF